MSAQFQHAHLLNTAIASDNVGDEIIMDACIRELNPILRNAYVTSSSSHDGLGALGRRLAAAADVVFMLGTNALSQKRSRPWRRGNWYIARWDEAALRGKVVLVGVGAARTFSQLEPAQARFLKRILSSRHIHSLRDDSALKIVEAAGLRGINTTCPTLWRWRDRRPDPVKPTGEVCFTLTKHKADPDMDRAMISLLAAHYQKLWFWPQQPRDLLYLNSIRGTAGINVIAPNLSSYDQVLARRPDVIGTRLHGTIRGLSHGCRTIVIGIDNRAEEISKHTGLTMIKRVDLPTKLPGAIQLRDVNPLIIDGAAIEAFLGQFGQPF